jgi:uncharacterized protein YjbJ (UPF0337 family)
MEDIKQIQEFFSKPLEENTFKKGDKVTYLGHPAVVTATKEYNGRDFVSVSYDKGNGKTKASNILATSGDVKAINEADLNDTAVGTKFRPKTKEEKLKVAFDVLDKALQDGDIRKQELALAVIDLIRGTYVSESIPKGKSISENDSYARVSKPRFVKDKNNPNFLNVYIDYDLGPGGSSIALGKETMTGQIRRATAIKAKELAFDVARDLKTKYNLEDIDVQDLENGKIHIFAVSDDFIKMNTPSIDEAKEKYTVAGRPVTLNKGKKTDGTDWTVTFENGKSKSLSDVLALIKPMPKGITMNEAKKEDAIDTITMDVPLFIRILEYSREDAKKDVDLHDVTDKAISLGKERGILSMEDYEEIVGAAEKVDEANVTWSTLHRDNANEKLLKQSKLSSAEYQKAKKLKDFNKDDYKWNPGESLYIKLNESIVEKVIAQLKEAKPGLWANINAKQERGEKPSHGNSDAFKSAVKAGKKINKLNEDEEDQFSTELDGFADQLAAEIKNELEDHKEEIQKSDKELNEAAVTVGIIGYILLSNTVANMLSKFAKNQFAKHNFGKGEEAAKKIYDFTHKNEEAFKAPIRRIVGIFTKDEKNKKMISDILYAIVIFLMAGQAGGEAVAYLKKASYLKGGIYGLKAAIKGTEVATILKGAVSDAVS